MIKKTIRWLVPQKTRERLSDLRFIRKLSNQIESVRKQYGFCVVFIAVPEHGNLGDQAIVYSQRKFFTDYGLGEHIVEIPSHRYLSCFHEIKKCIQDKDLIVIDGGGNMGSLWLHEEHKMQHIVQNFSNNKIIIFPETIFYSEDSNGQEELKKSVRIYSAHSNLHICAREKTSYDLMKKFYPTINILFVPDIVLYLNQKQQNSSREGAILCFRSDKEKKVNDEKINQIIAELKLRGLGIKEESTVIPEDVSKETREQKLNEKWSSFANAQIVITDRLHGMIFAVITGTPCIALNNSSGKVKGVYQWITNLSYVQYLDDIDEVSSHIDRLINMKNCKYDNRQLAPYFDKIAALIKE